MNTSCDQKMKDGACENNFVVTNTTSAVSDDTNNITINNANNTSEVGADSNISRLMNMMSTSDNEKVKGASKSSDIICEVNDMIPHCRHSLMVIKTF